MILLDVNMPGMDGFETAALIHQHPRFEKTPIIFVTGVHVTDLDRLKGYELGAVDYVYVPVVPGDPAQQGRGARRAVPQAPRARSGSTDSLERANAELARRQQHAAGREDARAAAAQRRLERANAELAQANGTPAGRDRRARARSSRPAARSEERLRSIVETALDAIITIARTASSSSSTTRPTACSARARRADRQERHRADVALFARPGPPVPSGELAAASGPAIGIGREVVGYRKDGRTFPMHVSVSELLVGGRRMFTSIARDITELDRARARARSARARPRTRTASRTSSSRRSPTSCARRSTRSSAGRSCCAAASSSEAERAARLEAIERNARAQAQLIEDLLDVSRIIIGQAAARPAAGRPRHRVIEAALDAVRPAAEAKAIRLEPTLDPRPAAVDRGDPGRLQQVVWNLLSNAIKFTPKGGRVEVRARGASTRTSSSTVSDTGAGIDRRVPAARLRPLPAGRRVDHARARRARARARDRAPPRRAARRHGRRPTATGEGQGATFTVTLPLAAPLRARRPRDRDRPAAATRTRSRRSTMPVLDGVRVLVVDDDAGRARPARQRCSTTRGARGADRRVGARGARDARARAGPTCSSATSACRARTATP